MPWEDRIVADPAIVVGKPVIKGTRIAVEFVLELMAEGWTLGQIEENCSSLTEEDLRGVLRYASDLVKGVARPSPGVGLMGRGRWATLPRRLKSL